jgi:tetratricopeptide (TPR) repeat protein
MRLHESLAAATAASEAGRLAVASPSGTRDLWFEHGRIVAVASSRDDERIGARLVAHGVVSPGAVAAALAARVPGECVGAALVRLGALPAAALRRELEALSLTLLARMEIGGGTLTEEPGAVAATETRTLDLPTTAALVAALRASDDIEGVAGGLGGDDGWVAADGAAPTGTELNENERYILSLLKRPRTVDALRRSALIDFIDALRAVAVLTVTGHVTACECRTVLPAARTLAEALALAPPPAASPGAGPAVAPGQPAPVDAAEAPRRNVRAMLDALDEAEANAAPMYDIDGKAAAPAQRRRVATMLESAAEMLAAGEERRAVRQLLTRALGVFPALPALLKLTELELADDGTRQLALDRLQRILAKNPRYTEAWLLLASYWGARGAPEKLRGCAARILAYEPTNADARQLLAGLPPSS